jgi:hypothetical protein
MVLLLTHGRFSVEKPGFPVKWQVDGKGRAGRRLDRRLEPALQLELE